jgi:hypothetical protein
MKVSAASSSAAVVTPARAFDFSRVRHRARIDPAAAIRSISSGVFLMIRAGPRGWVEAAPRLSALFPHIEG